MLGGVRFEGVDGLSGHSDGDTVCHALADALLGAAALGDVGEHFPESDPTLEGIAGLDLLARTLVLITQAGFAAASLNTAGADGWETTGLAVSGQGGTLVIMKRAR